MKVRTIATVAFSALITIAPAFAAEHTFKGVVSDSMCGRKHMMPGKSDAECIRECIKAKSKYALVTGDKVYILQGSAAEFEKVAGKHVQVTGDLEGSNLKVARIDAAK